MSIPCAPRTLVTGATSGSGRALALARGGLEVVAPRMAGRGRGGTLIAGGSARRGRAAEPHPIGEVPALVASPRASVITAAVIAADGGRSAI